MLQVKDITFGYSKQKVVLNNFSFSLKKGEHLCIMGESGCGKSTLLKAVYGLLDLQKGTVFWEENQVLGPEFNLVPGFEKFKYVAQDFDLMPYISVAENIKKFLSRFYPEESEIRTQELLEVIDMKSFENAKVKNLSGGQKQRVAIARALAKEPDLLLLDEPFSQIDNFKKNGIRRRLFSYLKKKNIACIVATHDKNDALSFADKLMVIKSNKILTFDTPQKIYNNPKQKYIAALFDDVNSIEIKDKSILVYPHQIKIVDKSTLTARVLNCYFKGSYWLVECLCNEQNIFLNHSSFLEKEKAICLEIKKSP
jgi:iron(III) transport system ATP-binding protein